MSLRPHASILNTWTYWSYFSIPRPYLIPKQRRNCWKVWCWERFFFKIKSHTLHCLSNRWYNHIHDPNPKAMDDTLTHFDHPNDQMTTTHWSQLKNASWSPTTAILPLPEPSSTSLEQYMMPLVHQHLYHYWKQTSWAANPQKLKWPFGHKYSRPSWTAGGFPFFPESIKSILAQIMQPNHHSLRVIDSHELITTTKSSLQVCHMYSTRVSLKINHW